MQDEPGAQALLEQLAAWLAGDLAGAVPREARFGVRVAANVAGIVARELAAGPEAVAAERERMTRLLALAGEDAGEGDHARELQRRAAAAIRAGRLDESLGAALELARDSVRAKLAVARPGYDDWSEPAA